SASRADRCRSSSITARNGSRPRFEGANTITRWSALSVNGKVWPPPQQQELDRIARDFTIIADEEVIGGGGESGDRPVGRMWHTRGAPPGPLDKSKGQLAYSKSGLGRTTMRDAAVGGLAK